MFCTDCIFDNEKLSDHGIIICGFDGSTATQTGGEVTFITTQSPNTNIFTFHTSKCEEPIKFTFSICKDPCKYNTQEEMYFTQDEQSYIMRWLQRLDGYKWLAFDQDGWEDVWFNAQINPQPHFINGRVAGYDLSVTTDSPWGWSQEHRKIKTIPVNDTLSIINYSDITGVVYPKATIVAKGNGEVAIKTGCTNYQKTTRVRNVSSGDEIILYGYNDFISGVDNIDNFNYEFPIMANGYDDIETNFTNIGDMDIDIKLVYRFVRRVHI